MLPAQKLLGVFLCMRLIVVMAGAFGFLTVLIGSLAWQRPIETSLVNGIISALVAGVMLRWWMKVWISSMEQASRRDEMSAQLDQFEAEANKQQSESKPSESRKP